MGNGPDNSLDSLHKDFFGEGITNAHDAKADVKALAALFTDVRIRNHRQMQRATFNSQKYSDMAKGIVLDRVILSEDAMDVDDATNLDDSDMSDEESDEEPLNNCVKETSNGILLGDQDTSSSNNTPSNDQDVFSYVNNPSSEWLNSIL